MTNPSYPAARVLALRIEARLANNTTAYKQPGDAPRPDASVIEEIVTAAFWASLRREEGRNPRISIAFVPPEATAHPLMFSPRLPLEPDLLARLAPAVERPGIHLGVWRFDDQFCIWGTTRTIPMWCFVLEVLAPGLLVVKYRRAEPSLKFANVAVLEGASVRFIEQQDAIVEESPLALNSLLAFYSSAGRTESDNVLVRLGVSMRDHGRGGSLLVVPQYTEDWRKSVVHPITYAVDPPFSEIRSIQTSGSSGSDSLLEMRSSIEALAGLTAVDGATVISDHFDLLAFGVKILLPDGARRVERILMTEPIEGSETVSVEPSRIGGTRHLSAAQFVNDQPNAIALVASQDGRFTVFAWSQSRQMVRAQRLDPLLL